MPLEASEYETLIRLSVTILVGILALVVIILLSRWLMTRRIKAEELDADQLKLEMEAIAEQKKKERQDNPVVQDGMAEPQEGVEEENEFIEGQPL